MGKYSSDSESGSSSSYKRKKSDRHRKGRRRSSSRSSGSSRYTSKSRRTKKSKKTRRSRSRERSSKHSRRHSRDRYKRSRSNSDKRSVRSRSRNKRSRSRSKRSPSYSKGAVSPWSKSRGGRSTRSSSRRRSRSHSKGRSSRRYSRSRTRTRSISSRRSNPRSVNNKSNDSNNKYSPKDDGSELLEKLNKAAVQLMSEKSKDNNTIESQACRETIINEINAPNFAPKPFISQENKSEDLPTVVEIPLVSKIAAPLKEEPGSLLHPNVCLLLEDQEEKLNRWVRKVYQIRQRSLNGEPMVLA